MRDFITLLLCAVAVVGFKSFQTLPTIAVTQCHQLEKKNWIGALCRMLKDEPRSGK